MGPPLPNLNPLVAHRSWRRGSWARRSSGAWCFALENNVFVIVTAVTSTTVKKLQYLVELTVWKYASLTSDESQCAHHALELEKGTWDVEESSRVVVRVLARNLGAVSE